MNRKHRFIVTTLFTIYGGLMIICIRELYNYITYWQNSSIENVIISGLVSLSLYYIVTGYIYKEEEYEENA